MKDPAKAALAHRVGATKENVLEQEEVLTTYCKEVIYLLATYAINDVITDI